MSGKGVGIKLNSPPHTVIPLPRRRWRPDCTLPHNTHSICFDNYKWPARSWELMLSHNGMEIFDDLIVCITKTFIFQTLNQVLAQKFEWLAEFICNFIKYVSHQSLHFGTKMSSLVWWRTDYNLRLYTIYIIHIMI